MEQYRLFDDFSDKVKRAIQLFQMFEDTAVRYHKDGYYLAFSGGKDSVVLYVLAKMAHVKFQAHYHLTTVDPRAAHCAESLWGSICPPAACSMIKINQLYGAVADNQVIWL